MLFMTFEGCLIFERKVVAQQAWQIQATGEVPSVGQQCPTCAAKQELGRVDVQLGRIPSDDSLVGNLK